MENWSTQNSMKNWSPGPKIHEKIGPGDQFSMEFWSPHGFLVQDQQTALTLGVVARLGRSLVFNNNQPRAETVRHRRHHDVQAGASLKSARYTPAFHH